MNGDAVFRGVCECLETVLDVLPETMAMGQRIIEDLGADSLDLLDLIFQLEQRFKIKISPRDIERRAKARIGDAPFQVDDVYTPEALAELRKALPEVPEAELSGCVRPTDLPRCFRVATFVNLVNRFMDEQHE